jgi:hypothetical protein
MNVTLCSLLLVVFPFVGFGLLSVGPGRKILSWKAPVFVQKSLSYNARSRSTRGRSNMLLHSSKDSESIVNDPEYLRMKEEAIQQLFQEQLEADEKEEENCNRKFKHLKYFSSFSKRIIPQDCAVGLTADTPVAFIKNRTLSFGNFRGIKGNSSAIRIEAMNGNIENIDLSQVVEVWNDLYGLSPNGTSGWQNTTNGSLKLLHNLPPQKSHLEDFYRLLNDYQYSLPLSSNDLSVYLFDERKLKSWLTRLKRNTEQRQESDDEDAIEDEDKEFEKESTRDYNDRPAKEKVGLRKFTSAERHIASILLFYDKFHFARKIPSKAYPEDLITPFSSSRSKNIGSSSYEVDEDGNIRYHLNKQSLQLEDEELQNVLRNSQIFLKGLGYKKLKYDVVRLNKLKLFYQYYDNLLTNTKSAVDNSTSGFQPPALSRSSVSTPTLHQTSVSGSSSFGGSSAATSFPAASSVALARISDGHTSYLINYFLRMLELCAMSNQNSPPSLAKTILKRYRLPLNSEGAAKLLHNVGLLSSNASFALTNPSSMSQLKSISNSSSLSVEMMKVIEGVILDMKEKRGQIRTSSSFVNGRKDLRNHAKIHPVFCLDTANSLFYDDAFSLSPETSEIFVHIVNSYEVLRKYSSLLDYAKQRLLTRFLPSGPIHMLPIPVLDSLKLSKEDANDVITLAVKVNYLSGEIYWNQYEVFSAIIGPVTAIDIENVNSMVLDKKGIQEIPSSMVYNGQRLVKYKSLLPQVYSDRVVNDLLTAHNLVEKIVKKEGWMEMDQKEIVNSGINMKKFETKVDPSTNLVKYIDSEHIGANRIVNTLLTIFSNRTYHHCYYRNKVPVPIAYCNRSPRLLHIIRRFATSALRNWIHLLQQQQLLSSIYRLDNHTYSESIQRLSRDQCVASVKHYNSQASLTSSIVNHNKVQQDFNELENHFQKILQLELTGHFYSESGKELGVIEAEGIGKGGLVKLKGFNNLQAIAPVNVGEGEIVKVKIDDIDKIRRSVYVSVVDD